MLRALGFPFPALVLDDFPLQGGRLTVQLREDADFRPQQLRDDRDGTVVHSPVFVAPEHIEVTQMHARDEEDGRLLGARVLADHRGERKAVDLGHVDIYEDNGNVGVEQVRQSFPA